ncbi:MAG: alpha/beta hydrolase [Rhodospirillaceae bacterium]|jgi:pimeloyl-ACP methyl ester carboxylesterase|nr:alpha/beta hydrolase [Rhodospirillaceae bacterium]MBT5810961.1 alpha/beta hydrolase [Rhodospirillaceae bacterium]
MHDAKSIFDSGLEPAEIEAFFEDSAERATTPCGDGEMVWRMWGDGPPLVMLHGGYGSWRHWIRNILPLGAHYRLYVPDIPGLGDSATVPAPYDADSIAKIISDGLDAILPAPARFHLTGFSFGGLIGGHVSAQQGERNDRLVLVAPGGLGITIQKNVVLKKTHQTAQPTDELERHRQNLAALMFANPDKIDDLAIYLQIESVNRARTKSRQIAVTDALRRTLPSIKATMDSIHGGEDASNYGQTSEREKLFRLIQPNTDFRIIPSAGHWVMYETPEAFNATLLELLQNE